MPARLPRPDLLERRAHSRRGEKDGALRVRHAPTMNGRKDSVNLVSVLLVTMIMLAAAKGGIELKPLNAEDLSR